MVTKTVHEVKDRSRREDAAIRKSQRQDDRLTLDQEVLSRFVNGLGVTNLLFLSRVTLDVLDKRAKQRRR